MYKENFIENCIFQDLSNYISLDYTYNSMQIWLIYLNKYCDVVVTKQIFIV